MGTGRFKFTKAIHERLYSEGVFGQRLNRREGAGHEVLRGASGPGGANTAAQSPGSCSAWRGSRCSRHRKGKAESTGRADRRDTAEAAGVQDLGGHGRTWMFTLKEKSSRGVT